MTEETTPVITFTLYGPPKESIIDYEKNQADGRQYMTLMTTETTVHKDSVPSIIEIADYLIEQEYNRVDLHGLFTIILLEDGKPVTEVPIPASVLPNDDKSLKFWNTYMKDMWDDVTENGVSLIRAEYQGRPTYIGARISSEGSGESRITPVAMFIYPYQYRDIVIGNSVRHDTSLEDIDSSEVKH